MPGDTPYARLATFRATWEAGDLVHEFSGLTTVDLDAILLQLEPKRPDELSGDLAWAITKSCCAFAPGRQLDRRGSSRPRLGLSAA